MEPRVCNLVETDRWDDKNGSQSVRVAVSIRPSVTLDGCSDCISVTPGEPRVQIGSHSFTFDYVYGSRMGFPSSRIFNDCVAPLIDAFFHGYNATVLAYGQTGSGKTYTMGTNFNGERSNGIIPKVMQAILKRVEETKGTTEFLFRVSFIEIYKEEVIDLLDSSPTGTSRAPIQIRENDKGEILLSGVIEAEVTSQDKMATFLRRGSERRATRSTIMNSQSSRSHAIFTISMEQKRIDGVISGGGHNYVGDDILCAKFHLVDLAGSEKMEKTGADGMRSKEGIQINMGLLALGNVISALVDDKKKKKGGHVPYRNSKLTRFLQDSLGGNAKTVMIACVSPAATNGKETLNTLKFANRARNIQNKAIVNRYPIAPQVQGMESQIEQLQAELLLAKKTHYEDIQILKQEMAFLQTSNAELQNKVQEHRVINELLLAKKTHYEDVQILKQEMAFLQTRIAELQNKVQEHRVIIEHLTKNAQIDLEDTHTSEPCCNCTRGSRCRSSRCTCYFGRKTCSNCIPYSIGFCTNLPESKI